MGFLEQYDELAKSGQAPEKILAAQFGLLQDWVFHHADDLFAELRDHRPILVMNGPAPAVVTRFPDVVEVTGQDKVFSVRNFAHTNGVIFGGANFLLGMDDSPQYEFEVSALRLAVRRTDLATIRSLVAANAKALTDAAVSANPAGGRLDVTEGFARRIPLQVAGQYFGVPGPSLETLGAWIRTAFIELFLNFNNDPKIEEAGAQVGRDFRAYVDGLIAERRAAGGPPQDDILGRLLAAQCDPSTSLSDERLRDNIIGLLFGMIDNTHAGVVNTLDALFKNPDKLQAAVAAAHASDPEALWPFVQEAMRFRPPAPVLVRIAVQDYVLAKGTDRETKIPAGKIVFAANASAMMDERVLDDPHAFDETRPGHHYLLFGWGLHKCFGRFLSPVQITEIVRSLLVLPNLRRASGPEGELVYDGFFPKSFTVEFG